MKIRNYIVSVALLGIVIGVSFGSTTIVERRVQVHNASEKMITKILGSSDGATYAAINIPNGIKPGRTVEVRWDRNASDCNWTLNAQYADRSESAPARFDLCEGDVTIEFN